MYEEIRAWSSLGFQNFWHGPGGSLAFESVSEKKRSVYVVCIVIGIGITNACSSFGGCFTSVLWRGHVQHYFVLRCRNTARLRTNPRERSQRVPRTTNSTVERRYKVYKITQLSKLPVADYTHAYTSGRSPVLGTCKLVAVAYITSLLGHLGIFLGLLFSKNSSFYFYI